MKRAILALPALAALCGCSGTQSVLDPKGPAAAEIASLTWLFTGLCTVIWVLVMLVLAWALFRRDRPRPDPLLLPPARERRARTVVTLAVAATGLIVVGLSLLSFFANRSLASIGSDRTMMISVTGHQWWWEIRYESGEPARILTTANEIHIPVGEPVRLNLTSTDVIHSFWVPSLAGKLDLIPGVRNTLDIRADKAGIYRGQCAEFCGAQHAHMGMLIVAESRPAFDAWRDAQLRPAEPPQTRQARDGQGVFTTRACVMCHQVRGTIAAARTAPDLTHIASRRTLAAGTLAMSRGNLAAWIIDPQSIKPGAHMPVMDLTGDELNQVVAFLEGLK